jgi:hypothetical protein
MRNVTLGLAYLLIALSVAVIVQSGREYLLWERGAREYEERFVSELPFAFAGHTFSVADDQPTDSVSSQEGSPGTIRVLMDGVPLGSPSRAVVRRGLTDIGRYHLWFDAWQFRERQSGRSTLWLSRRLQPDPGAGPTFEVITIQENGKRSARVLRGWQLGRDYPLFRSTQFIRDGNSTAFPLSMLDALAAPPLLLVCPVGTLILGLYLAWRMRRRATSRLAA